MSEQFELKLEQAHDVAGSEFASFHLMSFRENAAAPVQSMVAPEIIFDQGGGCLCFAMQSLPVQRIKAALASEEGRSALEQMHRDLKLRFPVASKRTGTAFIQALGVESPTATSRHHNH